MKLDKLEAELEQANSRNDQASQLKILSLQYKKKYEETRKEFLEKVSVEDAQRVELIKVKGELEEAQHANTKLKTLAILYKKKVESVEAALRGISTAGEEAAENLLGLDSQRKRKIDANPDEPTHSGIKKTMQDEK